jgi:hypothetical protein
MRAKIKRTRGGSLSVSEINSIINEINNNYGIKKEGTEIYVNIDSDMDELKKLLTMSEEGIDDYFKNKVNGVKNILELLNSLKDDVNDENTINKIKNMDTGFLPLSIRDKLAVLFNGIPVAPSMESVIPVAPPMQSVIPVAPPMQSVIPVAPPMQSVIPVAPPMESVIPVAPSMESVIPVAPSMESVIPVAPSMESVIPVAPSMESVIPVAPSMESVIPVAPPRTDLLKDISKGFKLKNITKESVKNNSINGLLSDIQNGIKLKKVSKEPKYERPISSSPMSGLLGEIQKGVTLKKISENNKEKESESPLKLSPQAQQMIQRRAALGYSDEEDEADEGWQGGLSIRFNRRVKSKRNSKKVKSKKRSSRGSLKR